MNQTLAATRMGGRISLMGVLTGFDGPINTRAILEKRITLQGICVEPVSSLRAVIATGIKPQVDQVFSFEQAEAAYDALEAAGHFGKLVVQISLLSRLPIAASGSPCLMNWHASAPAEPPREAGR